jgi:hypothetical protein
VIGTNATAADGAVAAAAVPAVLAVAAVLADAAVLAVDVPELLQPASTPIATAETAATARPLLIALAPLLVTGRPHCV